MPDWSYRTVLRPLLFCLPGEHARRFTVAALSTLTKLPGGLGLIDFLGHMRPDQALNENSTVPAAYGPVGLGALVDPGARAYAALSRFGAGFVEIGPVVSSRASTPSWQRDRARRTLRLVGDHACTLAELVAALEFAGSAPLWVRLSPCEAAAPVVEATASRAAAFVVEARVDEAPSALGLRVAEVVALANLQGSERPIFLSVALDQSDMLALAEAAIAHGAAGVWVRAERRHGDGSRDFAPGLEALASATRRLRAQLPARTKLVAGGVYEPEDVRVLLDAGADLAAVEAGLVYSGPGLIKRCNDALVRQRASRADDTGEPLGLAAARRAWFWALMLGLAMLLGGVMAFVVASTRVVLPYDEALCGMTRQQLMRVNPRLLPFMAHDRVTLAGSMLSVGVLYSALALHALRYGAHWAHVTVLTSALTGFASMFLFLGFGYFDPFHAFVTGVLFQFLLLCVLAPRGPDMPRELPEWTESAAWRRAQWGQLIFVLLGAGFLVAGLVIAGIGITSVFVPQDLEFMRTTAARLGAASERLVGLVAHDRASLGGMLMANGWAVLLSALWGFRAGAAWLWRALAVAGQLGFGAAIGVHYVVGYRNLFHLAPAFLGWVLWLLALALCRRCLTDPPRGEPMSRAKSASS